MELMHTHVWDPLSESTVLLSLGQAYRRVANCMDSKATLPAYISYDLCNLGKLLILSMH